MWIEKFLQEISDTSSIRIGIAVGTKGDWLDRIRNSIKRAKILPLICIDTANGHHVMVLKAIEELRREFGDEIHIMAGNIGTGEAYRYLAEARADSVMLGSLLAGTDEAPGDIKDGFKPLRGMASKEAKRDWTGDVQYVEGIETKVKAKGPVSNIIRDLTEGIRSGLSYSGARNIKDFQKKARFARQTFSAFMEGRPHAEHC